MKIYNIKNLLELVTNRLSRCRLIDLPKKTDPLGNLTFIEETKNIPFTVKRILN